MDSIAVIYFIKDLLLPPAGNILLVLLAWPWRATLSGRFAIRIALGTLVLFCMPFVAAWIARPLEQTPAFLPAQTATDAEAIVILGGGLYNRAPEWYDRDMSNRRTLERLRYGAFLAARTGLPIAVSGGTVFGNGTPEGAIMASALNVSFHTSVRWIEAKSRNTAENALLTRAALPIKKILLVTQALHMPRSRRMFEQVGFTVIPAPCGFTLGEFSDWTSPFTYLPSADALMESRDALHEYLGMAWYWLRYQR